MRAKAERRVIATLLSAFLAAVTGSPAALAQDRSGSGLPSGPGNPMAALQEQIDALTQQIDALNDQMAALGTSGRLGVFDAGDQKVGDVVGVQDSIPWVGLAVAGHVVVLQAFPNRLVGQFLWYADANCSGAVYISGAVLNRGASVFSIAAVEEPGGVVYAGDAGAEPQRVGVRSVLQSDGTCFTFAGSLTQTVLPATPLMTLDAVFTRPYAVH